MCASSSEDIEIGVSDLSCIDCVLRLDSVSALTRAVYATLSGSLLVTSGVPTTLTFEPEDLGCGVRSI